jgi:predicted nucleic acid-binding protein
MLVPDASVILKWVLSSPDEEDRDRALRLRDAWLAERVLLVVPSLWVYEVGNIVGRREPKLAAPLLGALLELQLDELPMSRWYRRALALMHRHAVTFYDAAYHAVALETEGTMVTADTAYVRKASRSGALVPLGELDRF